MTALGPTWSEKVPPSADGPRTLEGGPRSPREVPLRSVFSLTLCAAAGCGDSLLGTTSLDWQATALPPPEDPHLAVRWYAGPARGMVVPCRSAPVTTTTPADVFPTGWEVLVPRPAGAEPPAWGVGRGYRYAIGLYGLYEGPVEGQSTYEDPLAGLWGLADTEVLLLVEGDPRGVESELGIEPGALIEGEQWLYVSGNTTTFTWADLLRPENPYEGYEEGIVSSPEDIIVYHMDHTFTHVASLAAGVGAGGVSFGQCP